MRVTGIRADGSTGVVRYCASLAGALRAQGIDYDPAARPLPGTLAHWHLANSSRHGVVGALGRAPYVVTVHDVIPRTAMLRTLYRAAVYPGIVRRARRIVVHSRYAADLLVRTAGIDPLRIDVIPHGARPREADRAAARAALGWAPDGRVVVLPGVIKGAKLVSAAVEAVEPLMRAGRWRLALAGRVVDREAARAARRLGAIVLDSPGDDAFDDAIAAADVVLVLRTGSVGETNGPLLDAFGAGRAVLGTPVGSLPELADGAAMLTGPSPASIRAALELLEDDDARRQLEDASAARGRAFAWPTVADAHRSLFEEVARG